MEEVKKKLPNVSSSPHFRCENTTRDDMLTVIVAMIPMVIWGIYHFGIYTLAVTVVTVAAAVASEYLFEKLLHRPITIDDCSAVVTGLILSLNMPPGIPLWVPVIGAVIAIVAAKQLYGGLGQNFINPALAARCFLHISYASLMNDFSYAGFDSVSGATPLATLSSGGTPDLFKMFIGNIPGAIGEVSAICILIGAAFMLYRGVISLRIPLTYIAVVAVFMFVSGGFNAQYALLEVLGGGLLFGAFFMATDYVTSPLTPKGQIVYAVFIGLLTGVVRTFSSSAEGVSYSILLGNLVVPMIEKVTMPNAFGKKPEKRVKAEKGGA